jgi:PAS domain S-box-containing protein
MQRALAIESDIGLINATALDKHLNRLRREFVSRSVMLCISGGALAVFLSSLWPLLWLAVVVGSTALDIKVIEKALASAGTKSERRHENGMAAFGFALTSAYLALPIALMMSFNVSYAVAGIALIAAGATRSASMFAASRKVGFSYYIPYLTLPALSYVIDIVVNQKTDYSASIVCILALTLMLTYIWKAWFERHIAEVELDQAKAEAEAERDLASRDAVVSRLLFQHTTLRAALFGADGRFIAVNPSWVNAIGKPEAEIIGKTFSEVIPSAETHWLEAINKAIHGETTKCEGDVRVGSDGSKVFLDWEVQPWVDTNGSIGGSVIYAQDVTEVHTTRAIARAKQERLELALKASGAFIWEVDYAARTVTTDEHATEFYGQELTFEMVSSGLKSLVHPEDVAINEKQARKIAANGGYGRIEARNILPDGTVKWVRSDLAPKNFTSGVASSFVVLTSDITEEMARQERLAGMMERANLALSEKRKLLEELCGETSLTTSSTLNPSQISAKLCASESEESTFAQLFAGFEQILTEIDDRDVALAAAVQQLRDARAVSEAANVAKSQFLANMSHELRTPLNAIIGYTEILIEDAEYEQRTEAANDANKVRSSATHLLGLINEILDLSKIEAGKMDISREPTPLSDVISDIISSSTPLAAQNNNELIVEIDCDRTLALTDGFRLRQCLLNLMSNACKFTKDGKITLRLETTETDENHRWYDISVIDTGIGISEEQRTRLFKPFSQADGSTTRKYGGTGLGLALTREMTHLLGGEVFVESVEGEGSKFTLRIPALGLEAEDVEMTMATNNKAPLVLVVDDDPLARALTVRSATALGMSIASAETGNAALEFCERNKVDLVVLDLNLPDIDGNDVLAALRGSSTTRDIPVMVVSIDDDRRRSISAGAQEHLAKPCPSAVLTAAIARLARRANDVQKPDDTTKPFPQINHSQASDVMESQNNKRSA